MKLVSVNVSLGRTVHWQGRDVETGIFKEPVEGSVNVSKTNLAGDRQSDSRVHGGEYKAVYGYAAEHYDWWDQELGRRLSFGSFGENLTIAGFPEEKVCVGDRLRIGSVVLEAVQPRSPCFKLGLRFGDPGIIKRFLESGRWGVYFRVAIEGALRAGDAVTWEHRDRARLPVPEVLRLALSEEKSSTRLKRALSARSLPPYWRRKFAEQLKKSES